MAAVNFNPSSVQVIQSTENRQKVNAQQGISREEPQKVEAPARDSREETSSEQVYAQAWTDVRSQDASDPRTALYAGVRDLEKQDALKSSLSFSVYA